MAFNVTEAKQAGYSDKEIADYLAKENNFDAEKARKSGYSDSEIIKHLSPEAVTPKIEETQPQEKEWSVGQVTKEMFAPWLGLAKGAVVDPLLAINQLAAKALDPITPESWGVSRGATQLVGDVNQAYKAAGGDYNKLAGVDLAQLTGAIASPIARVALPSSSYVKTAEGAKYLAEATGAAKYGQSALSGAAASMLMVPVEQEDDFVTAKLVQAGFGGILGGAVPLTIDAAKLLTNVIKSLPISEAAKNRALQRHIGEKIGDDARDIITALRGADEIVPGSRPTVSEALADTPEGALLAAEQRRVAGTAPVGFKQRLEAQKGARQEELTRSFGTPEELAAMETERQAVTAPIREEALKRADVYGNIVPQTEARIASLETAAGQNLNMGGKAWGLQLENEARFRGGKPGWLSNADNAVSNKQAAIQLKDTAKIKQAEAEVLKNQIQTVKDFGFYPLETQPLVKQIDRMLSSPGTRSNSMLVSSLQSMRSKLIGLTDDATGIIKSDDLYNVRKEIAMDIQEFMSQKGAMGMQAQATKVESSLKKMLDASINKASNNSKLWSEYLDKFATYSKKIDQMQTGQALKQKLGEDSLGDIEKAGAFVNAVRDLPQTIKRATGVARYKEPEQLFTTQQMESINRVRADLNRKARAEQLGQGVQPGESVKFFGQQVSPQFISASVAFANKVMSLLAKGTQKELDNRIAELMLDPKKMADFIEAIPKSEVNNVVGAMGAKMSPNLRTQFIRYISIGTPAELGRMVSQESY